MAFPDSTTSGTGHGPIFFVLYQQLENHVLQPGRMGVTVQLSSLAVLIVVLIGAKLAGVVGALGGDPGCGRGAGAARRLARPPAREAAGPGRAGYLDRMIAVRVYVH